MEKLKSRKFWAGVFTGGSLIIAGIFDITIDPAIVDALTLICVTAFAGIGAEDVAKNLKK